MKEKLRLTEVWCKIALLFVFSAFYLLANPLPEESREFPQLLAVMSFALAAIALVLDFTRGEAPQGEILDVDDTELKVQDAGRRRLRRKRYCQSWVIVLVSTGVGYLVGFLFTSLCLLLGFALVLGRKEKRVFNAIVAVATTGVVYLAFVVVMKVPLVGGLAW
ncbi:MAG: tripartite tricarboxylate transporter TctB family protein [Burkholderiales bacterium]|nr:tripartite tricarboxylate transporter TctB family protein [Burkholderiales bacterium]